MAAEWSGFNAILAVRGVDPRRTKLYRHTKHPEFGYEASERWHQGRDQFLSFATYQNAGARIYSEKVGWCAHFLKEHVEGVANAARFLGVTRVLGPTRPFDETDPVIGYVPGEARSHPGARRVATPLAWEPWADWGKLSEQIVIDWGDGPRAKAQWAHTAGKTVLIAVEDEASPEPDIEELVLHEQRILRAHLSWERKSAAGRLAKELKPLTCEGCGLDGLAQFGPELANRSMEAHHLSPFASIPPGGRMVRPAFDFAILCATCHRLIHGLPKPDDLGALRALWSQSD